MAASEYGSATCDGGCGRILEPLPLELDLANIILMRSGWAVIDDKHFCPKCWYDSGNHQVNAVLKSMGALEEVKVQNQESSHRKCYGLLFDNTFEQCTTFCIDRNGCAIACGRDPKKVCK